MLIFILVRSYLSPIISTASSSGCVSLSFFVAPHPFSPLYTPLFSFPLCLFCIEVAPFSSSLSLFPSPSYTLSLTLVSLSPSAPFFIHPFRQGRVQLQFRFKHIFDAVGNVRQGIVPYQMEMRRLPLGIHCRSRNTRHEAKVKF